MTTTTTTPELEAYLAAVRAHLADLPADERDDLLDDLESHLLEVAAESDEPLTTRLGPPDAYAADLRSSAGLPPGDATLELNPRVARARQSWGRLRDHPTTRQVRDFLPELRPGWWVLRGVLVAWVLAMLTGDVDAADIPFPPVFDNGFVGLVTMVAAIVLSVKLGRRPPVTSGPRRAVRAAEVLLLLLTLPLIGELQEQPVVWTDYGPVGYSPYGDVLIGPDGLPISNIYATDADGNLIEQFQLYDQRGRPITNVADFDDGSNGEGTYRSQAPIGPDGRPIANGFPRDAWLERYDGTITPVIPPPVAAVVTTTIPAPATTVPAPETTVPAPETTLPPG